MDDSTREKFAASVRSALRTEAYIKGQMCYLGCRYKVLPNYRLTQVVKSVPKPGVETPGYCMSHLRCEKLRARRPRSQWIVIDFWGRFIYDAALVMELLK